MSWAFTSILAHQGFIKMEKDKGRWWNVHKNQTPWRWTPNLWIHSFNDLFAGRNFGDPLWTQQIPFYDTHQKVQSQIKQEIIDLQLLRWSIPLLVQIMEDLDLVSWPSYHWLYFFTINSGCHYYDADDGADYCIGIPDHAHQKRQAVKQDLRAFYKFFWKTTTLQPIGSHQKRSTVFLKKVYPYTVTNLDGQDFTKGSGPYQTMAPMVWFITVILSAWQQFDGGL